MPSIRSVKSVKILTTLPPVMLEPARSRVPNCEVIQVPGSGEVPEGIEGEILLTPPWDSGNFAQLLACGVKWVHTVGTGVDRVPFDLIGDRVLTCARGASSIPISEWILATMLAFAKHLPEAWIDEAPENWSSHNLGGLHQRTVGLVGLGAIGTCVAQHALSFGMHVCALRRSKAASPIREIETLTEMASLLERSDHVVLALPLTQASRHILNAESLSHIPANAGIHLVNVSRGALIDQDALRTALDDGRIECASLDVSDPEPLPAGHWLYSHPRVRLSPHISWSAPDALPLLLETFFDNLERYASNRPLTGLVDIEAGY